MKRNYSILLILMLIPVLILTACGGGGTTTSATQTTTQPAVTTSSPPVTQTKTTTPPPSTTTTKETPTTTATVTPTTTPPTTTTTTTVTPTTTATTTTTPTPTTTEPPDETPPEPVVFTLTSSAFENGEPIPTKYSYYGGNKSPPLSWSGAPEGTVSFALIMEDMDGSYWTHWVIFNIPADVFELAEGLPYTPTLSNGALQGMNDFDGIGYGGPSPPFGTHRYYFRLYALDTTLNLTPGSLKPQLVNAMQGHILGEVELMGTYCA